ncbi:8-amino-7-oxononanoate synthase isoform X4 [Gossypium hirsutum]|nr:8-amino-7-oxononanoate synthase isoform X4 [Gossypium hirsutum]
MALMVALRNLASLIAAGNVPVKDEKIAIFSDELNHASIIDGIRLAERQRSVEFFVYKHCDMSHLRELLSNCKMKKKVVVTDSCCYCGKKRDLASKRTLEPSRGFPCFDWNCHFQSNNISYCRK